MTVLENQKTVVENQKATLEKLDERLRKVEERPQAIINQAYGRKAMKKVHALYPSMRTISHNKIFQ